MRQPPLDSAWVWQAKSDAALGQVHHRCKVGTRVSYRRVPSLCKSTPVAVSSPAVNITISTCVIDYTDSELRAQASNNDSIPSECVHSTASCISGCSPSVVTPKPSLYCLGPSPALSYDCALSLALSSSFSYRSVNFQSRDVHKQAFSVLLHSRAALNCAFVEIIENTSPRATPACPDSSISSRCPTGTLAVRSEHSIARITNISNTCTKPIIASRVYYLPAASCGSQWRLSRTGPAPGECYS
jgi:hypothetical protein